MILRSFKAYGQSCDQMEREQSVLAYVYPLLGIFWTMLIFTGLVLMLWLIVWCFIDNFARRDHHGWAKFAWTVFILFLPIIGALTYIIARPAVVE